MRYFKDIHGIETQMKKHAEILRPKFEAVLEILDRELGDLEIGTWTKPHGGYTLFPLKLWTAVQRRSLQKQRKPELS